METEYEFEEEPETSGMQQCVFDLKGVFTECTRDHCEGCPHFPSSSGVVF